jgi:hypothetical protein
MSKTIHSPQPDNSLIDVVNSHLKQLSNTSRFDVGQADLRVASASLRFLLVENCLEQAWKASDIGGPMTFRTWCITSTKGDDVVAYCGGGEILPSVPFSACRNAELSELTLDLKAFRQRARIQVNDVKVSTTQLIQYVANTLGGAHFDPEGKSQRSQKAAFNLLRTLESGEISGPPFQVNGRNLLHHEILSIAQVVLRSPEVITLRTWRSS